MRVLLRTLSPLLGLALAAAGVLLVLEVAVAWARPGSGGLVLPWSGWQATARALAWSDTTVLVIAICVGVVGLLLVLVALLARRHDVALVAPGPEMSVATSPRVLARLVGRTVRASDDVAAATVSASRRRVVVRAEGWPDAADGLAGLRAAITTTVEELLDTLPLVRRPTVRVSTRARRDPR